MKNPIKPFLDTLFNLKEKIYHHPTDEEKALLKKTKLFDKMDDEHFQKMLHDLRLIKCPASQLIFHEGTQGDSLYIIVEGSVRVFTLDINAEKIPLARLNKGDYFGEQALLGQAYKTRNAHIETIAATTLIRIDEKHFNYILQTDFELKENLKKSGYEQSLNILSLSTGFYSNLGSVFKNIQQPNIIEFIKDEPIFNVGDKPDNVYIILDGEVKLQIPSDDATAPATLVLHKGHLFGELGVLQNKARAATAIAQTNTRLLVVHGAVFKQVAETSPQLKEILASLQRVYRLPMQGAVEQYTGHVKDVGSTITNIYKMNDGRSIISSNFIEKSLFTMSLVPNKKGRRYEYYDVEKRIELDVANNQLIGIESYGECEELPQLCRLLLDNSTINEADLTQFAKTGRLFTKLPKTMHKNEIICECMAVTRQQLQELIDSGVREVSALSRKTGAASSCRGCVPKMLEMLGENPWLSSIIKKIDAHNSNVNSYLITPSHHQFKSFKPGQYIIIQAQVGENWVERPYTISGVDNGSLRITLHVETKGFFTQWLAQHVQEEGLMINAMQPQGDFILNQDEKQPALCFAGGIGIAPFITFAKSLSTAGNKKRLHVMYYALTQNDFIFKNEFESIAHAMQSVTVQYRATREQGAMTEEEVMNAVKEFNLPEIYLCGSEGFVKKIRQILLDMNYDPRKIYFEEFVHAGGGVSAAQYMI